MKRFIINGYSAIERAVQRASKDFSSDDEIERAGQCDDCIARCLKMVVASTNKQICIGILYSFGVEPDERDLSDGAGGGSMVGK